MRYSPSGVKRMRVAPSISLTDEDRSVLQNLARSRRASVRDAVRARIVLLAADGHSNKVIAGEVGAREAVVGRWRSRFAREGMDGLKEQLGRGRKPTYRSQKIAEIVDTTLTTTPAEHTHWSTRTMADQAGVSQTTVRRIWNAHQLKPHLVRTFKLSNDKRFVEKLRDVVALYLNPPEHALVLCVDEKSQIQALDRTQPGLPMKKGRCGTMTHDYKRHGTTTLFAALNMCDGTVISRVTKRHRHQEYLTFLRQLDRETPTGINLHLIVDNYATHKHEKVKRWLGKHPRFHHHFIPTSSSWLNMVERFFRELTDKRIRRGVFRSVEELTRALEDYIAAHNKEAKPFIWTKSAEDILEKLEPLYAERGRPLNKVCCWLFT